MGTKFFGGLVITAAFAFLAFMSYGKPPRGNQAGYLLSVGDQTFPAVPDREYLSCYWPQTNPAHNPHWRPKTLVFAFNDAPNAFRHRDAACGLTELLNPKTKNKSGYYILQFRHIHLDPKPPTEAQKTNPEYGCNVLGTTECDMRGFRICRHNTQASVALDNEFKRLAGCPGKSYGTVNGCAACLIDKYLETP